MKLYVLASCSNEGNLTPVVFKTKEEALKTMHEWYDEEVKRFSESIEDSNIYSESYQLVYKDDTFVEVQLYECEVK